MKKALSRIVSLLLVLCLVTALVPAVFAADENEVQILFLDTSDVHGQQFATDYTQDASLSGTHYQSMTRVATYVKEQRAEYKNVFLSDSGDTIQGTPLTYYYAFMKKDVDDPAMKVMRMMDYDMWVVGNHEFNYGMDILQRQLNYLTSESTETESKVGVSMANYLDANTNNDKTRDWKTLPMSSRNMTASRSLSWASATPTSRTGMSPRTGRASTSQALWRPTSTTKPR